MFINEHNLHEGSWQSFERMVSRFLLYEGFTGIRLIGQTKDRGADVLANRNKKRWLFQVKHWKIPVGVDVVDRTLEAMRSYKADVPVIVSLNGFDKNVKEQQKRLMSQQIPLQLWDADYLMQRAKSLKNDKLIVRTSRDYQEEVIRSLVQTYQEGFYNRGIIVMATGLGKTFVASEAIRRINSLSRIRVFCIAHTNELVYQLERSFWPSLKPDQETIVWNGYERPSYNDLSRSPFVFACLNTVFEHLNNGGDLPDFNIVFVDECHHVGGQMYNTILEKINAGKSGGPFLLGVTATPWRPDETDIKEVFGDPLATVDMVTGLKKGFLSNVDYRMYTDNIDWEGLRKLHGEKFSPRQINRSLFITNWDDAVVYELASIWKEQRFPKAIVFCGTIDHAITMKERINAIGFCNAEAVYSQIAGQKPMEAFERNKILSDFHDGEVNVLCAVDILNEGVDVPDVNIIVFQRVTHSRRIFIQQLGRGLRISEEKEKVIVLDFVSDIRRFAAGLSLKRQLEEESVQQTKQPVRIRLPNRVSFRKVGGEDPKTETFLRQWLEDIAAIENAGEDTSILKFPPEL
jgi:superfamily II DNA or RNA helicase